MSLNDLLDLDLAAPPPSSRPGKPSPAPSYTGRSTFDYLAAATAPSRSTTASPSPIPSRSASPFVSPVSPPNGPRSPLPMPSSLGAGVRPKPASAGSGGDAFSSLFGNSPSNSGSNAGLSMAERLARDSNAKLGVGPKSWDPIPTSNGSSRAASPALHAPSRGSSLNVPPLPSSSSRATPDPWDFDLLAPVSRPASTAPKPALPPTSLDPFDAFSSFEDAVPPSTKAKQLSPVVLNQPSSPATKLPSFNMLDDDEDGFDRGKEEGLLRLDSTDNSAYGSDASEDDGFNILGALSQPLSSRTRASAPGPAPERVPRAPPSRAPSPPPHILGHLVEMGFSIQQARIALAATASPEGTWNVEGALEVLVEQTAAEEQLQEREDEHHRSRRSHSPQDEPRSSRRADADRRRRHGPPPEEEPEDPVLPPRPPTTGRRAREAAARYRDTADEQLSAAKVQEQAAELLAHASKIGFSVFKSANAYWESGRATIQKALDETLADASSAGSDDGEGRLRRGKGREQHAAPTAHGRDNTRLRGRPKWMMDDVLDGDNHRRDGEERTQPSSSRASSTPREPARQPTPPLFQDSDTEDPVLPQRPVARGVPEAPRPPPEPVASGEYRSPWRRGKANAPGSAPEPTPPLPTSVPAARPPPPPPAPKPSRPARSFVSVSSQQLVASSAHKAKGNELFKLGRFGDAEQLYGQAIDALPAKTLALIPLYNNRANARLKNGDEKGAADDCTRVVGLILGGEGVVGGRVDPAGLDAESATLPPEAKDVNLRDHLAKALGRRAKANEVNERWRLAMDDWAVLLSGGETFMRSAGGTKLVSEGLARCRKAVNGDAPSAPAASAAPVTRRPVVRPEATAAPRPPVHGTGEAVKALRSAAEAAANEDDLRLSLKDGVDARIAAWKNGKEANLRALIASLDNVLWPELGWKKVGMHELVTDGQLKVRYVRAIAKVHPDKLNVSNTTVEQRMIAGAVFAGLNDAWNSAK